MDYVQLQKECPDFIQQFIIEPTVMIITLQIPFMKKVLSIYEGDLIDASLEDNFLSDHFSELESFFNDENQFLGGGYMDLNDEDGGESDGGNDGGNDGDNDKDEIFSTAGLSLNSDTFALPIDEFDDDFGLDNNGYDLNNSGFDLNDKSHAFPNAFPIDNIDQIPMIFSHGCITDAAHKFFTNGKLLVTCCYFEILKRWQSILLSWIGRENTETYEHHFFKLFIIIAEQLEV
jgi:hypothetical protein